MNMKKLQHISLALTLSLLALAGVLALLGAGNGGPAIVQAEALSALPVMHLAADDGGWTHSGTQDEWEWGVPSYNGGHDEPLQCAPGSIEGCWVTDLNNTYNANSNQDLTSVVITLPVTATTPISVTWYQAWYIESVTYDHAWAEYSCNGGAWTQMWGHSGGVTYQNWQVVPGGPYTLTCVAGDTLELRYHLDSDSWSNYAGYYIDSIYVFDAAGHDLYVEEFEPPPAPELHITKQADPRSGGLGGIVTYTLAVSNTGNLAAAGALLTDTLDAYQRPQSAATSLGSCAIADSGWGGVVTCTLGDLGIGATAYVTLTAQVTETIPPPQQIINTAEVSGGGDSASTQISLWPDLQITKQANRQTVGPGGTVTYTLHINNAGSLAAANTTLTDTLDVYQQLQSVATNWGTCAIADPNWGGVVTCTLGELGIGDSAQITLTAQVTGTEPLQGFQQITNTAEVAGGGDSASAQTALWLQSGRVRLVEGVDVTPYDTIQEAIDAASGVDSEVQVYGTFVDINQYGGHDQMVYISKTLTLRGGYNADYSLRDPDVYTTTLNAQDNGRVIYIIGSGITVTVDGLHIWHGYYSGDGYSEKGGGVYIEQASVTISDCLIQRNGYKAWNVYPYKGGGVFAGNGATVLLENNEFDDNWAERGGGIYAENAFITLLDNHIHHNNARDNTTSEGGGIYLNACDYAVVQGNRIGYNVSEHKYTSDYNSRGGAGLKVHDSDYVLVTQNDIYSNTVLSGLHVHPIGGGVNVGYSDYFSFTHNLVYHNEAADGVSVYFARGGGLYTYRVDDSTFAHNQIYANVSAKSGGGVVLRGSRITFDDNDIYDNEAQDGYAGGIDFEDTYDNILRNNRIHHNTSTGSGGGMVVRGERNRFENNDIYANHSGAHGGGISLGGSNQTLIGNHIYSNTADTSAGGIVVGGSGHELTANHITNNTGGYGGGVRVYGTNVTFVNNLIADNSAITGQGGGLSVSGYNINLWHTTLARNSGPNAIYAYDGGTATFTHTLVYSHSVGAETEDSDPAAITMTLTLWDAVPVQTVGLVNTLGDITGTAAFAADGYHLTAASDAIDRGAADTNITDDIDSQPRPMGDAPDLGADEFPVSADLALHKTGPSDGTSGQMLTYTLTITNAATSEIMADARVVDTVEPASAVASLSGSTPGGDCTTAGAVITCDLYNIVTDTERTLTVWVTPTATYDGILTNTATVTPTNALDPDGADNAAGPITTTIIYIPPFPDLWVNKAAPAYAEPGETIVYSVTWGNSGSLLATSSILTDTLPAGVTFVAANPPQDSGPNPLVWNLGDLAPGASGTHVVTVTVNGGLSDGTVLTNTVLIAADTFSDTAVAATTIYQLGGYDLKLHKEILGGGGTYEYGDEVYYNITISNTGQLAANIDLLDEIPAGTAYIAGSVQANGDGTTQSLTDDSGKIRWLGDMGAGGVEVVSFGVTVISPQGVDCGTVRNEAHAIIPGVSYQWESQVDFNVLSPDLGVSIEAPQYAARESESVMDSYPIIVTYQNDNNHLYPGDAYTTVLTVTLPNNNALLWESDPPPTQQISGQEWVWNLGTIVEGVEQSIEITIQPSPATAGNDYLVRAEIGSQTPECCQPNQPEEADAHTYMVDMHFQKSAAAPKQYWSVDSMGKPVSRVTQDYYLEFQHQNADPNAPNADPYRVDDTLPADLDFNTATWNPAMDTNVIDFQHVTFSSLQPLHTADRAWIRMNATADNLPGGQVLTNHATLSYTINGENLSASAEAASTVPIFPPLTTFPENGELCGGETGQVDVHGNAQPNVVVKLFVDTGDGFEEEDSTTADADGIFHLMSFSPIPEGLTETLKLYTKACDPADPTDCSAPSNQVEVWDPDPASWCPQLSYWQGTVKAGPLKGEFMHFGFRDSDGNYSTSGWQMPGVYGFWDTDLYIYACCNSTAEIVVTADGIEYQPVDVNGKWHHFHIDRAHNVTICSSCDSEEPVCTDGDILIDPDGYVFNVDEGGDYSGEGGMFSPVQAISGVTVTCMVSMPTWGGWVPWPAHLYEDQVNPQVTDDVYPDNITTTGYYAFFTPPGFYYIDVQGGATTEGSPYQHWRSPVVQVITEIVHVNVPYTPWAEDVAATITVTADGPDPATVTIAVGETVAWNSTLRATDTITDLMTWSENPILHPQSDLDPLENVQGFDAGFLEPGRVYRRTFAWPGTYPYTDANGNTGTVIVTGEPPYKYIYLPLVLKNYTP